MTWFTVLCLAFIQTACFAMVSRARNRDNTAYHIITSVLSNGVWFFTIRELVAADLTLALLIPYTLGTTIGSVFGAKISMKIEGVIGALADPKEEK